MITRRMYSAGMKVTGPTIASPMSRALAIVFALSLFATPATHAQTFSVIHTFTGDLDGSTPYSGLTMRGSGLFGTTSNFGLYTAGSVYELTHTDSGWTKNFVLVFYGEGRYGETPWGKPVFGPDGHLYGTTFKGGQYYGFGVVYSLTPPSSACKTASCHDYWAEHVLHSFNYGPQDGQFPVAEPAWDAQGNIYVTTSEGGAANLGAIVQLTQSGDTWTTTLIHSFAGGIDGSYPDCQLVVDNKGNFYGTTSGGGAYDHGTVFRLSYVPGVGWQKSNLYDFQDASDGGVPNASLISDSGGNLYGATRDGGDQGGGTVFQLSPSGDTWIFKVLYGLPGINHSSCGPGRSLAMDAAGNFYGTSSCNGAYHQGNVFKLTNTGNGWTYASLHDFTGGSDGGMPRSEVAIDADGTLYGTASAGGNFDGFCGEYGVYGCGTVWMIKP